MASLLDDIPVHLDALRRRQLDVLAERQLDASTQRCFDRRLIHFAVARRGMAVADLEQGFGPRRVGAFTASFSDPGGSVRMSAHVPGRALERVCQLHGEGFRVVPQGGA